MLQIPRVCTCHYQIGNVTQDVSFFFFSLLHGLNVKIDTETFLFRRTSRNSSWGTWAVRIVATAPSPEFGPFLAMVTSPLTPFLHFLLGLDVTAMGRQIDVIQAGRTLVMITSVGRLVLVTAMVDGPFATETASLNRSTDREMGGIGGGSVIGFETVLFHTSGSIERIRARRAFEPTRQGVGLTVPDVILATVL